MRTDHQQRVLLDYLGYLRDLLCLSDWTLRLSDENPEEDTTLGMIEPLTGRKVAYIYLKDDFCDMSIEDQTHTLVHELIHLHHISATDIVRIDVEKVISRTAHHLLWGSFMRQMEYCVDGLADAFSRLVKEIDYTEKSKESSETTNDNQA